jgi:hypothetical protein
VSFTFADFSELLRQVNNDLSNVCRNQKGSLSRFATREAGKCQGLADNSPQETNVTYLRIEDRMLFENSDNSRVRAKPVASATFAGRRLVSELASSQVCCFLLAFSRMCVLSQELRTPLPRWSRQSSARKYVDAHAQNKILNLHFPVRAAKLWHLVWLERNITLQAPLDYEFDFTCIRRVQRILPILSGLRHHAPSKDMFAWGW